MALEQAQSKQNEALYTIAKMNGYNGPKAGTALKAFFNSSDALKAKARAIGVAMANGGAVDSSTTNTEEEELNLPEGADQPIFLDPRESEGKIPLIPAEEPVDPSITEELAGKTEELIKGTMEPVKSEVATIEPSEEELISEDVGKLEGPAPTIEAETIDEVVTVDEPEKIDAVTVDAEKVSDKVEAATSGLEAKTGTVSKQAQSVAAQQETSKVSDLTAAQGTAHKFDNEIQRELEEGELVSGSAVDATKAAKFTEQVQAAEATPSKQATVQGQLEDLMQDFEGGETPPWAAGAMRAAMAGLASRGLGASSMSGQAVIQAAMESALPIAQADAATRASFESQNLSNRQARAMLAAEQRAKFMGQEFDQEFQTRVINASKISDIANMNFTADQQIQLENARFAQTMNIENLNARQGMVLAEAAALSSLDLANLNNRQQSAVQNAQNFLQMDLANLSNEQQTALFKTQQNIQGLFNDQSAENAAAQFNASSENQTNQFFASLASQVGQFNASQQNAMNQFNVNTINSMREFNAGLTEQRDMFNASNGLVIAQANALWRQNATTANTAAANESNMSFAKTMNGFTATNLDAYWQRERDLMSFAFTSAENAADRLSSVLLEKLSAENKAELADEMGKGSLTATLLKGALNYISGESLFKI